MVQAELLFNNDEKNGAGFLFKYPQNRTSRKGSRFLGKIPEAIEIRIVYLKFFCPAISLNDLCVRGNLFWH